MGKVTSIAALYQHGSQAQRESMKQYHLHLDCGATIVGHDTSLVRMKDGSYKKMKCVDLKEETRMGIVQYMTIYPAPLDDLWSHERARANYWRLLFWILAVCFILLALMGLWNILRFRYVL